MKTLLSTCAIMVLMTATMAAQQKISTGYFTFEGASISDKSRHYLVVKDFIPLSPEQEKVMHEQGMMTFTDFGPDISRVIMGGDKFRSMIYALDNRGDLLWSKPIGLGHASWEPAIGLDDKGRIYVGENDSTTDNGIRVSQLDSDGSVAWSSTIDSLENVHDVYVGDDEFVTLLTSYISSRPVYEVKGGDSILHFDHIHVYHIVRLNKENGEVIYKQYDPQATYLGDNQYSEPSLAHHHAFFSHREDTLYYLRTDTALAAIVSKESVDGWVVRDVVAGMGFHAALAYDRESNEHRLISERYSTDGSTTEYTDFKTDVVNSTANIMENELGGYTITFASGDQLELFKFDGDLRLTWKRTFDIGKDQCDKVISVNKRSDNGYQFYFVKQHGKKRSLYSGVISEKGAISLH